ncbi:hypothetical protein GCM10023170_014270 [Phytohabitans houttuyneae]|uniref:Uncharacterized protein n=1 Tax=Phytohabitans houttuyneae TaxID=1076126 RepID=A0A6V8KQN2_9ACTN|nr:hypothetical protein Phou_103340 [Phytohabitans houttuyneae]
MPQAGCAAFVEGSIGYQVGAYRFPAVPVTIDDVGNCLTDLTHDLQQLHRVHTAQPLREGYEGTMILAVGRAGNT